MITDENFRNSVYIITNIRVNRDRHYVLLSIKYKIKIIIQPLSQHITTALAKGINSRQAQEDQLGVC